MGNVLSLGAADKVGKLFLVSLYGSKFFWVFFFFAKFQEGTVPIFSLFTYSSLAFFQFLMSLIFLFHYIDTSHLRAMD